MGTFKIEGGKALKGRKRRNSVILENDTLDV